jgi:hypothetical protein
MPEKQEVAIFFGAAGKGGGSQAVARESAKEVDSSGRKQR